MIPKKSSCQDFARIFFSPGERIAETALENKSKRVYHLRMSHTTALENRQEKNQELVCHKRTELKSARFLIPIIGTQASTELQTNIYMSLRCDDMPSNAHTGAGPSASTVRDPAAIWVWPASICGVKRMAEVQGFRTAHESKKGFLLISARVRELRTDASAPREVSKDWRMCCNLCFRPACVDGHLENHRARCQMRTRNRVVFPKMIGMSGLSTLHMRKQSHKEVREHVNVPKRCADGELVVPAAFLFLNGCPVTHEQWWTR